jgi:uncharacterized membrane protein HdeD (DUF308 family)
VSDDNRSVIGIILLIVGVILLISGIVIGISSVGVSTNQQNGAYNALTSGTLRLYLGIGIGGVLGVVLIIAGAYLLVHQ